MMWLAKQYVGEGNYMVCLGDDTRGIKYKSRNKLKKLKNLPTGGLRGIIALGWQLMTELKVSAWGLNHINDIRSMHADLVCRNLGLLDGNCYGDIEFGAEHEAQHIRFGVRPRGNLSCLEVSAWLCSVSDVLFRS